jgi:C1A family cysteine protease
VSRRYGCRPDRPDGRDHRFALSWFSPARYMPEALLPAAVDLRASMPPVMDQGELGSCTAHGVTAALRFNLIDTGRPDVPLSRLQLYYDSRALEGDVGADAGAEIRDVIKCAARGVGRETLWPYAPARWTEKPPASVYADAVNFAAIDYQRVAVSARGLRTALYVGRPVVIGVTLFASFESDVVAASGRVPMPGRGEREVGGHCMVVCGYGPGETFTVRNSWGDAWGDRGDAYLPAAYLEAYGRDFWTILTDKE